MEYSHNSRKKIIIKKWWIANEVRFFEKGNVDAWIILINWCT